MATRRKPHDPAKATLAAAERRAREAEIARLTSQGATVTTDRAGHVISAYRSNVFNLLLSRGTITQSHHDAASQLADTWATWKGLDGRDVVAEFVDNGRTPPDKRCLISDRMLFAGKRIWGDGDNIVGALEHMDERSERLLIAFMVATVEEDRPMAWRGVVERAIGETVRDKQTAAVVEALEALRVVYEQPRRQAA